MKNSRKRKLVFLILITILVVIPFMSIGYSALATTLNIRGDVISAQVYYPRNITFPAPIDSLLDTSSCMVKYEGQVTDQVGVTTNAHNVYFNKCSDKRNIIFGDFCWQMIRTTETGGIKMIYNGEPVSGKCLSTRGDHTGIVGPTSINQYNEALNSNYLYGTNFSYNTTNNTFTLLDTFSATWNNSTYQNLIGKFTCKNTTGTCTTLYNVNGYASSTEANITTFTIESTNYAQIGTSAINAHSHSLARVGYMFNTAYAESSIYNSETVTSSPSTYYYSDKFNKNADGTYTVVDYSTITSSTWASNYQDVRDKYVCKGSSTCSELWYAVSTVKSGVSYFNYFKSSQNFKFGSSYTYSGGTYTITGDTDTFWNFALENTKLNTRHYTCLNESGVCSTISYFPSGSGSSYYYLNISDGKGINDAINEMLFNSNVNRYNSTAKGIIESWYRQNLSSKTNMLEDTVFCNNRSITNLGGWNPDGGRISIEFCFKNYNRTTNMTCPNSTDQFAVSNNNAKLTYPVALMQQEEWENILTIALTKTGAEWWTISPYYYRTTNAYESGIDTTGGIAYTMSVNKARGIRPVVSLKNSITISSGDGSEASPWVVN